MTITPQSWIDLRRDGESGIEAIRAHFTGHAYDPHWHDSYLIGVTEQGVQQFHSRRRQHRSRPGTVFMLEPEEIHDGDAIDARGFTYRMLYVSQAYVRHQLSDFFAAAPAGQELHFAATLRQDAQLAHAVWRCFDYLWQDEVKMVKEAALDRLFLLLSQHPLWRNSETLTCHDKSLALRARDWLMAHYTENPGLQTMAQALNVDRFRLSREFQAAFGLPPHAWLIQLRLCQARQLLATGRHSPADVAAQLGFADQSHLGRWFKRTCHISPARYQLACTNLPDPRR